MAKKNAEVQAVEPEVVSEVEDVEVDLPISDEVEIDDGSADEDEEFFEETTPEDEDEELEIEENEGDE